MAANRNILDYGGPPPKPLKLNRPYWPSVTFLILLLLILLIAMSIFLPMYSTAQYFPIR